MTTRVLLIDGHSLAYRAFYALPVENFVSSTGQHTNAIYGFASMLINLIRDEKPTHIAAAFDVSRKTFRTEKFPEYKANRKSTPDEFRSQISYIYELLNAFQIPAYEMDGFEADDLIATIVSKIGKDSETLICTGDRDSFQLVTDSVTVLYPKKGVTDLARMTPAAVEEKYGLTPEQYPDFAALRGDPSDNLPSIPGVGEKTAAKWVIEYKSLENLLSHVDEITGKAGDSLRASLKNVRLNRELTQLRNDVPLEVDLSAMKWRGIDQEGALSLFEKLEIKALRDRIKTLSGSEAGNQDKSSDSKKESKKSISSSVKKSKSKSEFIEFSKEQNNYAYVLLDQTAVYLTFTGKEIFELEFENNLLRELLISTHQGKQLAKSNLGGTIVFDSEIAAYLINPGSRDLGITEIMRKFLAIEASEPDLFAEVPASEVILHMPALQEKLLTELSQREQTNLFRDLEMPTMILLAQMESIGIAVDEKELGRLHNEFAESEKSATKAVYSAVGREFNVSSPKQLQAVLFEELKLPKTKRIKTGFSTDAESLEWLYATTKHPVLQNLLRIREVSKLRTTVEGLQSAIARDGRIHTNFQQTVAATGRLSSTEPNLQNIPIRTEEGRKIRNSFVAQSPYNALMTADYSQIEMRIMAHLSNDAGLLKAFAAGEDLHSTVASQVFGVSVAEVDSEMRRQIKAMSYGLAYGLSSFGLAQQLDISPPEASALMAKYFERFGGIQDYLKEVVRIAREKGYTETILGRRRYLPDLNHENRQRREVAERMALNAPIQGSAADIIKVAMLKVSSSMKEKKLRSRILLQVHDELIFEVADGEEASLEQLVRKEMGAAYPLRAPLDVNVGFGRSWDSAAH
ncbi:MAG: polymerase [Actinomycetota bacterium]|jgi:DNA polymerase-1